MSKHKIKILSSVAGYDLAAADYDKKEKYLNSFEKGQLLPLFGAVAVPPTLRSGVAGKKILDVGAGTGRLADELGKRGADVTALDVSPNMLAALKKRAPEVKTIAGDAEALPFGDGLFDYVVAAFLIVHLKDPAGFFGEAYRVLKDGGRLIVTNINQKEPPEIKTGQGAIKIESFYHRPEKIRELLTDLAFNIEKEIFIKENDLWVNQIIVAQK